MGIDVSRLSPAARQQVARKLLADARRKAEKEREPVRKRKGQDGQASGRIEELIIPYPGKGQKKIWCKWYGLNAIYAGKPWNKRNEDRDFWHRLVCAELLKQKVPRFRFERPVTITMWWNDNMDIDNHAYMGKMIVDSLKGWLLQDDTRQYFAGVTHRFHDRNYIRVKIEEVNHEKNGADGP